MNTFTSDAPRRLPPADATTPAAEPAANRWKGMPVLAESRGVPPSFVFGSSLTCGQCFLGPVVVKLFVDGAIDYACAWCWPESVHAPPAKPKPPAPELTDAQCDAITRAFGMSEALLSYWRTPIRNAVRDA